MANKTVPLGVYLFTRLRSLGIRHVIGVPGDFNLTLLDYIYHVEDLKWVGTCNELNAAYAADGYARIKETPGALVTTYGVGELSAMCGVGGAYAEESGMIHIVGTTSRMLQEKEVRIHHTLGNEPNDHTVYQRMSAPIRKTSTFLTDEKTMASEIDRVIVEGVKSKLPVYIYVPTDVVAVPLDAERLETPLDTEIRNVDTVLEDRVVEMILSAVRDSKTPCVLGDVSAIRHGARELTRRLAEITKFPAFSTLLGKGIIDEDKPYYQGVYNGSVSFPGIKEAVEDTSDLVLNIGVFQTDSNTGGFSRNIDDKKAILLHANYCQILGEKFAGLHFLPVLKKVVEALESPEAKTKYNLSSKYKLPLIPRIEPPLLCSATSGKITQDYIWQRLGRFLKPNDIVIVEVGTAQFGMPDATFPANIRFITQVFWSAIGYTVGATLGALIAAREQGHTGRVVLIIGDGSLQISVQEISTYIRNGFTPTIFLINNDGYTIERAIHGKDQTYNDISMGWDHQMMLRFFGAREEKGIKSRSVEAKSIEALETILVDQEFQKSDCIQLCEIYIDKYDCCWRLRTQIKNLLGACEL